MKLLLRSHRYVTNTKISKGETSDFTNSQNFRCVVDKMTHRGHFQLCLIENPCKGDQYPCKVDTGILDRNRANQCGSAGYQSRSLCDLLAGELVYDIDTGGTLLPISCLHCNDVRTDSIT